MLNQISSLPFVDSFPCQSWHVHGHLKVSTHWNRDTRLNLQNWIQGEAFTMSGYDFELASPPYPSLCRWSKVIFLECGHAALQKHERVLGEVTSSIPSHLYLNISSNMNMAVLRLMSKSLRMKELNSQTPALEPCWFGSCGHEWAL